MVDGKRVLTETATEELNKDFWTYLQDNGIRYYELLFKSGIAKDGQNYDLNAAFPIITGTIDPVKAFADEYLGVSAYDTTSMDDLSPDAGTMEALTGHDRRCCESKVSGEDGSLGQLIFSLRIGQRAAKPSAFFI